MADLQKITYGSAEFTAPEVDQAYDATSANAQSGTAVAQAVAGAGGGNATFDVTAIPQGPTGASEINAVASNADNENARVSYIRQSDGTLPSTVNLGVKSGLGEDSFVLPTKALVDAKQDELISGTNIKTINNNSLLGSGDITISGGGGGALPSFDGHYYARGYLHSIVTRYASGRNVMWTPDGSAAPDTNGGYAAYPAVDESTSYYASAPVPVGNYRYPNGYFAKEASISVDEFADRYYFNFAGTNNGNTATASSLPSGYHAIDFAWGFEYPRLTAGYKPNGPITVRIAAVPLKMFDLALTTPPYVIFEDNTYQLFDKNSMQPYLNLSRTGYFAVGFILYLTKTFTEGSAKGIKDLRLGGVSLEVPKALLDLGLEDTNHYWS